MASNRGITPEFDDEAIRLAMENIAMAMASRGKRVWEPARTEDSERIAALRNCLEIIASTSPKGEFAGDLARNALNEAA